MEGTMSEPNTEHLQWHDPVDRPPIDSIVLLITEDESGNRECWMGYWDGEAYRHDTGVVCEPHYWAKPRGPEDE